MKKYKVYYTTGIFSGHPSTEYRICKSHEDAEWWANELAGAIEEFEDNEKIHYDDLGATHTVGYEKA